MFNRGFIFLCLRSLVVDLPPLTLSQLSSNCIVKVCIIKVCFTPICSCGKGEGVGQDNVSWKINWSSLSQSREIKSAIHVSRKNGTF